MRRESAPPPSQLPLSRPDFWAHPNPQPSRGRSLGVQEVRRGLIWCSSWKARPRVLTGEACAPTPGPHFSQATHLVLGVTGLQATPCGLLGLVSKTKLKSWEH